MGSHLPPSPKPRRSVIKCAQCRKDKKRCQLLDDERWSSRGRCVRCADMGYACGPVGRADKAMSKKRSVVGFPSDADCFGDFRWRCFQVGENNAGLSPESDMHSSMNDALCWSSDTSDSSIVPYLMLEPKARAHLEKLSNLHAARELLRADLRFCDQVNFVENALLRDGVRAALEAVIRAVGADFQHEVREAGTLIENDNSPGYWREVVLSELLRMLHQFIHPATSTPAMESGNTLGSFDQKLLDRTLQISRQFKTIHYRTDFICCTLGNSAVDGSGCVMTSAQQPDAYLNASTDINRVLAQVVPDDLEHKYLLRTMVYPPSHIAYMRGDENASFELWKSGHFWENDILQRTLLHRIAYRDDVQMLRRCLRHCPNACYSASRDIFGLTPLQIAASRGHVNCFSLIWQFDSDLPVKDVVVQRILELAAKNGNQEVVACIIKPKCKPSLLVSALAAAVGGGHQSTAELIIFYLDGYRPLFDEQLQAVWEHAQRKKLDYVAAKLADMLGKTSVTPLQVGSSPDTLRIHHPVNTICPAAINDQTSMEMIDVADQDSPSASFEILSHEHVCGDTYRGDVAVYDSGHDEILWH